MGLGYDLWVTTISEAIDNIEDIDTVMDAFSVVDNLTQDDIFYGACMYYYCNDNIYSVSGPKP